MTPQYYVSCLRFIDDTYCYQEFAESQQSKWADCSEWTFPPRAARKQISSKMTFECFLTFLLFSTVCVETSVEANECYVKLLPNISPSFEECNLFLYGTVTVDLKDFVDRPHCLNKNIDNSIGVKFNQELAGDSWDKKQNLDQNTVFTFHNTETLCKPVNVTIGQSQKKQKLSG